MGGAQWPAAFGLLADLVLVVHLAFVVFVVLGGCLLFRWPRLAWLHLPSAAWGVYTELGGVVCPLTPLENALRARGGQAGFAGGFIDHYVTTMLYPEGLTRGLQIVLGLLALTVNGLIYWRVIARRRATRRMTDRV
jgi:hypothetical protein